MSDLKLSVTQELLDNIRTIWLYDGACMAAAVMSILYSNLNLIPKIILFPVIIILFLTGGSWLQKRAINWYMKNVQTKE